MNDCVPTQLQTPSIIFTVNPLTANSITIEKLGAYVLVVLSVVILLRYTTFSTILRVYGCVCMNVVGLVCGCVQWFLWMDDVALETCCCMFASCAWGKIPFACNELLRSLSSSLFRSLPFSCLLCLLLLLILFPTTSATLNSSPFNLHNVHAYVSTLL